MTTRQFAVLKRFVSDGLADGTRVTTTLTLVPFS